MAAFVLLDANVRIATTQGATTNAILKDTIKDLTPFILSATLNYEAELVEDTSMSGTGTRSRIPGLKDWSLEMTMKQDFSSEHASPRDAGPDAVLWPLLFNKSRTYIQVAANGGTLGAANPRFYGVAVLQTYTPLAGSVGELSTTPANFMANGPLKRASSGANLAWDADLT